ncbi:MAG TPA: hypothetical protein VFF13_01205 [archaeon]|nr:hypothetical protein [archaeon]
MDFKKVIQLKLKRIVFAALIILAVSLIVEFIGAICIDGIDFGYCVSRGGTPFSFLVMGEINAIPQSHLANWFSGFPYLTIGNTLFAPINLILDFGIIFVIVTLFYLIKESISKK